ncbi:MAG: cytidine deaminase [Odoribacter sp.]|nr:cytidine deaminase [Odoribacter sp.]
MDKREVKIDYFVCRDSFPEEYDDLCRKAVQAAKKAYSVYSKFSVGAAVWLENGEVVAGNNQENIAYPSGICAERTALFYAGATFPDVPVKAMAIVACGDDGLREEFISPCGACRQVMAEVIRRYGQDFDVLMLGKKETVVIKASALLPFAFEFSL